jgi:general secretion pathway protein K
MRRPAFKARQQGAALLTAMVTVTLVAALSATALWQQWRGVEIEAAERKRQQSAWILWGALDWARIILRKDISSKPVDHLGEPWAVPLQEARLSSFLSTAGNTVDDPTLDLFLSGSITDLQGRLNVRNLINGDSTDPVTEKMFTRLFASLQLPPQELVTLRSNLRLALISPPQAANGEAGKTAITSENNAELPPLLPRSIAELVWLGLSPSSTARLTPYIAMLPERTPINLNTAPELVLHAAMDGISLADAQAIVKTRAQAYFETLDDASSRIPFARGPLSESVYSVNSRYFEIRAHARQEGLVLREVAVVQRQGSVVSPIWRERGTLPSTAALSSLQ